MSINRQPNGSIEIKLHLSWNDIQSQIKIETEKAISNAEIPGFRKGKAPRDLVEPKLDKSQLLSQSLAELLPKVYSGVIDTEKLKPILYPQIHIDKGVWGQDFEFTATTCESPTVTLPQSYVENIPKLQFKDANNQLSTILEYLHTNSQVQIPDPLIVEESNHRLSRLAENLSQLGIDMSKYLTTKKITAEDLKAQTAATAKADLEIEFILETIQSHQKLLDRQSTLEYLKSLSKDQAKVLPKT